MRRLNDPIKCPMSCPRVSISADSTPIYGLTKLQIVVKIESSVTKFSKATKKKTLINEIKSFDNTFKII